MTVQQGSGFMLKIPADTNDNGLLGGDIELTFGVTELGSKHHLRNSLQSAHVSQTASSLMETEMISWTVAVAMKSTSGNQVVLTLGDLTEGGSDIDVADSDTLSFNIIAFGIPALITTHLSRSLVSPW